MGRKGARFLSSVGYQVFQFDTECIGPLKLTLSIIWGQFLVSVQSQRRHLFLTTIMKGFVINERERSDGASKIIGLENSKIQL